VLRAGPLPAACFGPRPPLAIAAALAWFEGSINGPSPKLA
jgi:hypothetical protein